MSAVGYLETLLTALPEDVRKSLIAFTREAFGSLAFGTPSTSSVATENFAGHLVPFTTSSVANAEVAVAHKLARVPRLILTGLLDPSIVNMTAPVLTITRAADPTNVYVKSATTTASGLLYVE